MISIAGKPSFAQYADTVSRLLTTSAYWDSFAGKGARADIERREHVLLRWYRCRLRELIPPLLEKWERTLGVSVADRRIKRMKTKWGACNVNARRIWVNLELAKKPVQCLEYILVQELCHLLERHHTERFTAIMDQRLPRWRSHRKELSSAPLAHESWAY